MHWEQHQQPSVGCQGHALDHPPRVQGRRGVLQMKPLYQKVSGSRHCANSPPPASLMDCQASRSLAILIPAIVPTCPRRFSHSHHSSTCPASNIALFLPHCPRILGILEEIHQTHPTSSCSSYLCYVVLMWFEEACFHRSAVLSDRLRGVGAGC